MVAVLQVQPLPDQGHAQVTLHVQESDTSPEDEAKVLASAIKGQTAVGKLAVVSIQGPENSIGALCGHVVYAQLLLAVSHIRKVGGCTPCTCVPSC